MAYPVRTVTQPSALAGQTNGRLDASILHDTPAPLVTWPCRLVHPAARAWRALSAAALAAGHTLKPSGPHDSYRPYETQERIFLQRFTTSPVSRTGRQWQGRTWYLKPGYALAAVPGTSNHGRAIAVDVGEERDGDTGTESIDQGTLNWLLANEERFGWSHEVQSEPWHIRYFAGDRLPQAVLDHEADPQEDDMTPEQEARIIAEINQNQKKIETTYNQVNSRTGAIVNLVRAIAPADVDEELIAAAVLAGLDADAIAAAVVEVLPDGLAQQVLDGLRERLET